MVATKLRGGGEFEWFPFFVFFCFVLLFLGGEDLRLDYVGDIGKRV